MSDAYPVEENVIIEKKVLINIRSITISLEYRQMILILRN